MTSLNDPTVPMTEAGRALIEELAGCPYLKPKDRREASGHAANRVPTIEAEAAQRALQAAAERVAGLRPRPNLQGSPVNAYCNARDDAVRLLADPEPR